jgi:hypothetical protein
MYLTNLVRQSSIKKNTLSGGRLPSVYVGNDSDISVTVNGRFAGHLIFLVNRNKPA